MPILEKKQELFKPVKELWGEIGCKDISVFNETNKILNEDKLINTYNNYVDSACYHSINYYDNIKLLLLVNLSKKKAYNYYVNNLKQTHIIYGIKTIDVKFDLLDKILYQVKYQNIDNYENLLSQISKDYPFYDKYNLEYIEINIVMLVDKKKDIIILPELKNSIVFYTNTNYQKKVVSSIFYNENSMKFIEMQNLKKLLSDEYKNNLKQFFQIQQEVNKYDHFTQEKIMYYGSLIFMSLGFRKNNDIDIYIHNIENNYIRNEITNRFNKLKEHNKIDMCMKNTENWPSHWDTWLDEWSKESGANYFEEIIGLPNYHYYFCGAKIIDIKVDIVRRKIRRRPASSADLIMLNSIYDLQIEIPQIMEYYDEYKKVDILKESEKNELIKNDAIYDEINREYKIKKKTNINFFLLKSKEYLQDRFDYDMNIDELKKIFNVKDKILKIKIKKK